VMKDYKLEQRILRASHNWAGSRKFFFFFFLL